MPALYGILGDKDAYLQLEHQHDPELLSRYPSFHPPASPLPDSSASLPHDPPAHHNHPEPSKPRAHHRQRPSVTSTTNENLLTVPEPPVSTNSTGQSSWYDPDAEVFKPTSKTPNKLVRRSPPTRPPPPVNPSVAPHSSSRGGVTLSEPAQPFARVMKPRKSSLKQSPAPIQSPGHTGGSFQHDQYLEPPRQQHPRPQQDQYLAPPQPSKPSPLPATAYLSPQSAARRRLELQRASQSPPSSSRSPPQQGFYHSPATTAGRLSSVAGSHRGSSAGTSSVAYTMSSYSNSYSQGSALNSGGGSPYDKIAEEDGEPDERQPKQHLFVVNPDDSASERSFPAPKVRSMQPHPPVKPVLTKRKPEGQYATVPPVPPLPPKFSAPPPPPFSPTHERSISVPTMHLARGSERDQLTLKRNASDHTQTDARVTSQPIPIPPTRSSHGHSTGGPRDTSDSGNSSSSCSCESDSPHHRHRPHTSPSTSAEADIPPEWIYPLPLTLEQLFQGGKYEYRITRHMLSGATKDQLVVVDVKPGWKPGTRITFPAAGNERSPNKFQDVIFVVEQVHHERFARLDGGRLVVNEEIDLVEALKETTNRPSRRIVGLDGKVVEITPPPGVVKNGMSTVVKGQGMYLRSKGQVVGRGDLVVKWNVRFPKSITPSQFEAMKGIFVK